jgi:hypothetical protein
MKLPATHTQPPSSSYATTALPTHGPRHPSNPFTSDSSCPTPLPLTHHVHKHTSPHFQQPYSSEGFQRIVHHPFSTHCDSYPMRTVPSPLISSGKGNWIQRPHISPFLLTISAVKSIASSHHYIVWYTLSELSQRSAVYAMFLRPLSCIMTNETTSIDGLCTEIKPTRHTYPLWGLSQCDPSRISFHGQFRIIKELDRVSKTGASASTWHSFRTRPWHNTNIKGRLFSRV